MNKFILLLGLILPALLFCQGEADTWYFGENAGIHFNPDGTVTPLTDGQLVTYEGCATISDPTGNLLFYTDGINIFDRTHSLMPNGTGLLGNPSMTQSAIVVPWPMDPNRYIVFTVRTQAPEIEGPGLNYTVVDMTLNSGNGDVVAGQKNINLLANCAEKIAAVVKDCTSESFWVMAFSTDPANTGRRPFNTYHAFEINSTGVVSTAVTSASPGLAIFRDGVAGYLKFSPDETKLASANMEGGLYFYDFDPVTGLVSNEQRLSLGGSDLFPYGIEFSPNSRFLYTHSSSTDTPIYTSSSLFQFDLQAADISNSRYLLDPSRALTRGALQLGPNGKIYRARSQTYLIGNPELGVINDPNQPGAAAGYQHLGVNLSGRLAHLGLPSFVQTFYSTVEVMPENTGSLVASHEVCEGESLVLETQEIAGGSYTWLKDGVPVAGQDTHILQIDPAQVSDAGVYSLIIIKGQSTACPITANDITVVVNPLPATTANTLALCDEDANPGDGSTTIDLTQLEDTSFNYFYYETPADRTADNPIANPTTYINTANPQPIYYKAVNPLTGCENNNGEYQIDVFAGPTVTLDDTYYLCASGPLTLSGPAGLDGYQWIKIETSGDFVVSTTQDASITQIGNYRLEGSTDHGTIICTTDEFFEVLAPSITAVDIIPNATVAATSFTVCEGEALTLETQDLSGASYVWSKDGSDLGAPDSRTFEIPATASTDSGDYTVTITGPGELICPVEGNIAITVDPMITASNETLLNCDLDTDPTDGLTLFDLTDIETNSSFTYSYYATTTDRDADIPMANPQNFNNTIPFDQTVYYRIANSNGCENVGELELQVRTGPDLTLDATYWLCVGDPDITISAPAGIDAYQWYRIEGSTEVPVSSNQDASITQIGNYRLEGSTEYTVGTLIITCGTSVFFEVVNPSVTSVDIIPNGDTGNNGTYTVCEGQLLNLETQVFAGASYLWEKDGMPLGASNTNILQINPTSLADAGSYTVTISGPGELSCPITGNLTLVVDNMLDPVSLTLLSCDLDVDIPTDGLTTLDLTQFESDPSFIYSYFISVADRDAGNAMANPESFTNTQAFDQTVYFRITNSFGCEGLGDIQLQIRIAPEFTLEESFTICPANPDLTIPGPDGYDVYNWFMVVGGVDQLVSENQNFVPIEAGDYRLDATVEHANGTQIASCTTSTSFIVVPSNPAIIDEIQVSGYGDFNEVTVLVSGEGDYEYSIDGNNYQDENVFNNLPVGEITFYVQDKNGCGITEETKDIAEDLSAYGFPKFFTPNGDGINDFWQFRPSPGSFEIDLATIRIFNRYGNMLAQIEPNSSGWDGRFNGKQVPSTDYWFCAFTMSNQEIRGHFSLKR